MIDVVDSPAFGVNVVRIADEFCMRDELANFLKRLVNVFSPTGRRLDARVDVKLIVGIVVKDVTSTSRPLYLRMRIYQEDHSGIIVQSAPNVGETYGRRSCRTAAVR